MAQIQASRIRFICSRHVFFGNSVELMEKFIFPRRSKLLNFFPAVFSSFFFSPNPIQLCSPPFRFACMPFSDLFSSLFFRGPFRRASWQAPPWIASRSNFSWRKMIREKALSGEMYQKCSKALFKARRTASDYAIYIRGTQIFERWRIGEKFKNLVFLLSFQLMDHFLPCCKRSALKLFFSSLSILFTFSSTFFAAREKNSLAITTSHFPFVRTICFSHIYKLVGLASSTHFVVAQKGEAMKNDWLIEMVSWKSAFFHGFRSSLSLKIEIFQSMKNENQLWVHFAPAFFTV